MKCFHVSLVFDNEYRLTVSVHITAGDLGKITGSEYVTTSQLRTSLISDLLVQPVKRTEMQKLYEREVK